MCGIPQIPWHSLYVKRYASAFVGLRVGFVLPLMGLADNDVGTRQRWS